MGTPVDPEEITEQVFADAEEFLGFNIQTDLLDQLSGEWAVAGTTDLSSGSALLLSEVEDPEVVAEVVAEVTELLEENSDGSFTLSSRTTAGVEVTVIEADADGIPLTIEFGVIDDVLAVGINGWLDLCQDAARGRPCGRAPIRGSAWPPADRHDQRRLC